MERQVSAFAIDLTQLHRRTVTSFYSNLVTRPTGRAVRMGVEQQLVELGGGAPCLSILDFSQVRVLDYSCADEIVAKLLIRYAAEDRPVDAYFVARGLQDHHLESVEAVLDRHGLLLVAADSEGEPLLLGPCDRVERSCWSFFAQAGASKLDELVAGTRLSAAAIEPIVRRFVSGRVAAVLPSGAICPVSRLTHG